MCIEENKTEDNLVNSLFWETTPENLFLKKYSNEPAMKEFLLENIVDSCVYLDEIFTSFIRQRVNLWNLKNNIETIQHQTQTKQICFRTINQKLVSKIQKDFPNSKVFIPNENVPDSRYFIMINF